jgi:hypothetical protein
VCDFCIAVAPLKSDHAALYLLQKRAVHGGIEAAQGFLDMRKELISLNAFLGVLRAFECNERPQSG